MGLPNKDESNYPRVIGLRPGMVIRIDCADAELITDRLDRIEELLLRGRPSTWNCTIPLPVATEDKPLEPISETTPVPPKSKRTRRQA